MTKKQTLVQQLISGVLFLAAIGMLAWLSVRYKAELDWTAGKRNTLTEASVRQLASMKDPVKVIVFAPSGADARRALETDLAKYRRVKPDIELVFIDPSAKPEEVKKYNVSFVGEVVLEYQGRRESLRATTEQSITTALQRLSFAGDQWVVFLEGHGERALTDAENPADYAKFAQALRDKGLKVQSLSLVKNPKVPDNTSVLVIASPQNQLLEGEQKLIKDYVEAGGNLLWLADPEQPPGMTELAKALGIVWQDGYAIFPDYQIVGTGHPGFYAATSYPPNPVTTGFTDVTLFPLVRSVIAQPDSGWNAQPMLDTSEAAWLETGSIADGHVALDDKDIPGPLHIGLVLTREHKGAEKDAKARNQRVALVGDADFLANAYVTELGNQQLGLNIVQWLASRDAQLNIDIPKAPDVALYLPGWALITIALGFVLVLPLLLLGLGITRWMIRRRK
ncbi:MAG TPA: GldG family protein [Solimonas sp.]|nr:GldG family protein [Solimonas sp.]